jgi:long-subunit fatty acid transport protein
MKTRIIQLLAYALVLASPAVLLAQNPDGEKEDNKVYLSFGQNFAHSHAHDLTETTWGGLGAYHAELGVQFLHNQSNLHIRANGGYTRILGNPNDAKTVYDLFGVFCGLDLVYAASKKLPLTITAGPSFHSWSVEQVNAPGDPRMGERSLKFGWRVGVGYDITKNYRVDFTYTMTEWRSIQGTGASGAYQPGFNPCLPAYFTLKGSYTF